MFSLQKSKQHNILSLLLGYYLVNVTPERFREQSAKLDSAIRGETGIKNLTINMWEHFQDQVDGEAWGSAQFQVLQRWSHFHSKQEASFYNFSVGKYVQDGGKHLISFKIGGTTERTHSLRHSLTRPFPLRRP